MEKETLLNLVPKTSEEKLLWEREQNKLLVKENQALANDLQKLAAEFVKYKKTVEKQNIPQMLEKMNKVKAAHANLEIEYKRIVNANKGFMDSAIAKNIKNNELLNENLRLLKWVSELKKKVEELESRSIFSIFKIKKC